VLSVAARYWGGGEIGEMIPIGHLRTFLFSNLKKDFSRVNALWIYLPYLPISPVPGRFHSRFLDFFGSKITRHCEPLPLWLESRCSTRYPPIH